MNPLLGSRKKESYHPRKIHKYIGVGQKKQREPRQESERVLVIYITADTERMREKM